MVRFMSEAPGREGADDVEAERRDPGPKFFEIWRAPEVERAIELAPQAEHAGARELQRGAAQVDLGHPVLEHAE